MSVSVLHHEMIIERDGQPLAVIMPYDEYMSLIEKLEDLEDALAVAEARSEYRRDPSSVRPYEEFRAELA